MWYRLSTVVVMIVTLMFVACTGPEGGKNKSSGMQTAEPDMDSVMVRTKLDSLNQLWCSGFTERNGMIIARLFAESGALLAPPDRTFRDSVSIADFFQKTIESNNVVKDAVLTPKSLWIVGSDAIEIGSYTYVFEPYAGIPYTAQGLYYANWRQMENGKLKLIYYAGVPSSFEE